VDLEADPLDHDARVINEIGDGGPAGLLPIQGRTPVSPAISHSIFSLKQLGDLGRFSAAAHAAQKLLREV